MHDEKVDAKENSILNIDYELLSILLKDKTTKRNIIWATDNYESKGFGYRKNDEIKIELITGYKGMVIKPRTKKSKQEQLKRVKEKAEVFTPSWICNSQNNLVDNDWFGRKAVFNTELKKGWKTKKGKIKFPDGKTWMDYIEELRLEMSCGEAPYLVSRYDTVDGNVINVPDRIGLLDRKLRIINENVEDEVEWIEWVKKAYKSIYGFDWQGDNVLIARENLLYTFFDNYEFKFKKEPDIQLLKEIAEIITWNIWQMDGIKFVIPNSCKNETIINMTLFGDEIISEICYGCKKNNIHKHNGTYSKIMNWKTNRQIKFISLFKRR